MQSNLYVHTKYENMEEIYLYPIWEFFVNETSSKISSQNSPSIIPIQRQ